MTKEVFDLIIIGGGPAGFTAAIYASRASLSTLVLEGTQPGGQLTTTTEVENFPGFPKGIMGPELMNKMREQMKRFGAQDSFENVTKVDFSTQPMEITTSEKTYLAKSVILATGASPKHLGLESEQQFRGRGVSYCATCDGAFFKDKDVIVVGGGDSAMEEATFLAKFASKVYVFNRSDKFRASPIMLEKARSHPKIEVLEHVSISEVLGDSAVSGVMKKNNLTGEKEEFPIQGIFVAIGHKPNNALFVDKIELDKEGYVITKGKTTQTNLPGVFAAGDVADREKYWQGITAAGSGCKAALDAQAYLEEQEANKE